MTKDKSRGWNGPKNPGSLGDMDDMVTEDGEYSIHPDDSYENAETEVPGMGMGGEDPDITEPLTSDSRDLDETQVEHKRSTTNAILWVKDGNRRGHIYPLGNGTIIGRTQGSIILDDPKVSQIHAKFVERSGKFIVTDFASRNGTYVNGKRINAETVLDENDVLKIGDSQMVLKLLYARPKAKTRKTAATPKKKTTSTKKV